MLVAYLTLHSKGLIRSKEPRDKKKHNKRYASFNAVHVIYGLNYAWKWISCIWFHKSLLSDTLQHLFEHFDDSSLVIIEVIWSFLHPFLL